MKKFNTKHAIKNNFVSTEEREGVLINRVKLSKQRHKKLDKGKGKKGGEIKESRGKGKQRRKSLRKTDKCLFKHFLVLTFYFLPF